MDIQTYINTIIYIKVIDLSQPGRQNLPLHSGGLQQFLASIFPPGYPGQFVPDKQVRLLF